MAVFVGMDVQQVEEHARRSESAGGQLEGITHRLIQETSRVAWYGPDADAFRNDAMSALDRLAEWGDQCHETAARLREHALEQEIASSADGNASPPLDVAPGNALAEMLGGLFGNDIGLANGTSLVLSNLAQQMGNDLGEYDAPDDDIAPIDVEDITRPGEKQMIEPNSIHDIVTNLESTAASQTDDATNIRVQEITGSDGVTRYIVYVPGSYGDPGNIANPSDTGGNPMDWNQNGGAIAGQETDSSQAVRAAMEAAGIPHGAEVVIAGHSQGGIVASNLAANPEFNGGAQGWNVTDLVTVGSPVENLAVPPGTNSINFAHQGNGGFFSPFHPGDPVPSLDGNPGMRNPAQHGTSDDREEVYLPASREGDPLVNHGIGAYLDSIENASGTDRDAITSYENSESMKKVIGDGSSEQDTVDVPVSRDPSTY